MDRKNREENVEEALLHLRIPRWPAAFALLLITAAYSVVSETLTLSKNGALCAWCGGSGAAFVHGYGDIDDW